MKVNASFIIIIENYKNYLKKNITYASISIIRQTPQIILLVKKNILCSP